MISVVIIGLGTTGSALVPLVARMPGIFRVTLVDPDEYTTANLSSQAIDTRALGRLKVEVQAASIRAIDPHKIVETIAERVETVPIAVFRESIAVSCVDNRRARQTISRMVWRCGTSWIDAAVDGSSLVRVGAFSAARDAACLECSWDAGSYESLEQEYPCDGAETSVPATGAPAELGAIAASLLAAELRKRLDGSAGDSVLTSSQLMLDTSTYSRHLNRFEYNQQCRFDHEVWTPEIVAIDPAEYTLGDFFRLADVGADEGIGLEGHSFATSLHCPECGEHTNVERSLVMRLSPDIRHCRCGRRMFAPGFSSSEQIRATDVPTAELSRTLGAIGFRPRDVLTVSSDRNSVRHVEIGSSSDD